MTLTLTTTSGSPGIDRFSPAQLLRTARLFASDPACPPWWILILGSVTGSSRYLQIWLASPLPGPFSRLASEGLPAGRVLEW